MYTYQNKAYQCYIYISPVLPCIVFIVTDMYIHIWYVNTHSLCYLIVFSLSLLYGSTHVVLSNCFHCHWYTCIYTSPCIAILLPFRCCWDAHIFMCISVHSCCLIAFSLLNMCISLYLVLSLSLRYISSLACIGFHIICMYVRIYVHIHNMYVCISILSLIHLWCHIGLSIYNSHHYLLLVWFILHTVLFVL